ncbi:hypothetical protein BN1708_003444 [Verticillium longisporum]|uniref:WD repeat-containing protein 75 second beta-propeller domain-containing protein n=1 Tax=Verticillium longisporum TaxID=100787 RepID=A0A0G4LGD3_VERLO|nr:U3 small nucleolar RNA-associated protein 17 like [Verticillium longisporum]CRK21107.1 hypothetical protein BN1708_003444 [Verticillium longisporum]
MVGKTDQKPRAGDVDPNKKRKRDASDKQRNSDIKRNRKDEKQSTPKSDKRTSDANELKGNALKVLSELQNGETANTTTKSKDQSELQSAGESNGWKISSPLGGRIADIDPVFSSDAKHLILTYHTSLQVYSVADSLLVRRIPLPIAKDNKDGPAASVLTTHLSPVEPDFVWVGCSDGRIWKFNWRQGIKPEDTLMTKSHTALDFCVSAIKVNKDVHDVVFVSEKKQNDEGTIVAYCRKGASHLASQILFKTVRPDQAIHMLRATADGKYVVGAHSEGLVVGTITGKDLELEGDFFNFDTSDIVCTLDIRVTSRQQGLSTPKKQTVKPSSEVLDVIIGCGRGSIFLYNDIMTKLQSMRGPKPKQKEVQARKFHWHRRAVRSVKWSKDGHYLVSGGSENTLVLWQVDTAITTYLPHLPGAIENIVVSPSGAHYAVHLDDNSAMVISTSEMKPVTYVSGIQSAARYFAQPKDTLVKRVGEVSKDVRHPIPAALSPLDATKLHVCVGTGQQAMMSGSQQSAPILQSFDLDSFTSVSKQALARTQPTDVNITAQGNPISEPAITHIAFSSDARWLATVDDWSPPTGDIDNMSPDAKEHLVQERREINLKFWSVSAEDESLALTSRINSPHSTSRPETVLALAADPAAPRFATLGDDGLVRIWHFKTRQTDGLTSKDTKGQSLQSWSCGLTVGMGSHVGADVIPASEGHKAAKRSGSMSFSEDGSSLFVAFGSRDDGTVYIVDTHTGETRTMLENMWKGDVRSLQVLSPYIVTLSNDLRVYDVVADELQYGVKLPKRDASSVPAAFAHLQVDKKSRTFAMVVPFAYSSQIAVFKPEDPQPLCIETVPHRITSLVSSASSSGFVALDDAAQLWSVTEVSDQSAISLSKPLEDLRLDTTVEDDAMNGDADEDDQASEIDFATDGDNMELDDDETHTAIVSRQKLAELFDAAPAFAMPSIEDMFYKVTGLLTTKPLASTAA